MQLFYIIAFNFYTTIKGKISEACNTIHYGWYINYI